MWFEDYLTASSTKLNGKLITAETDVSGLLGNLDDYLTASSTKLNDKLITAETDVAGLLEDLNGYLTADSTELEGKLATSAAVLSDTVDYQNTWTTSDYVFDPMYQNPFKFSTVWGSIEYLRYLITTGSGTGSGGGSGSSVDLGSQPTGDWLTQDWSTVAFNVYPYSAGYLKTSDTRLATKVHTVAQQTLTCEVRLLRSV